MFTLLARSRRGQEQGGGEKSNSNETKNLFSPTWKNIHSWRGPKFYINWSILYNLSVSLKSWLWLFKNIFKWLFFIFTIAVYQSWGDWWDITIFWGLILCNTIFISQKFFHNLGQADFSFLYFSLWFGG